MSRTVATLAIAVLTAGSLPAVEAGTPPRQAADRQALLDQDRFGTWDLRLNVGNAVPCKSLDLSDYTFDHTTAPDDLRLGAESEFGWHAGVQTTWQRHFWGAEGITLGWMAGLEAALDNHRGRIVTVSDQYGLLGDDEATLVCTAVSLSALGGLVWRFDGDTLNRLAPSRFQLELYPILGLGMARVDTDTAGLQASDNGLYLKYGGMLGASMAIDERWRFGLAVGYQGFTAEVDWDDSDDGTAEGEGIVAQASLVFRL